MKKVSAVSADVTRRTEAAVVMRAFVLGVTVVCNGQEGCVVGWPQFATLFQDFGGDVSAWRPREPGAPDGPDPG